MLLKVQMYFGLGLLLIGLVICYGNLSGIQSFQGETGHAVSCEPSSFAFWMPSSYRVLQVPDFMLFYLIIGVILSTSGFIMLLYSARRLGLN